MYLFASQPDDQALTPQQQHQQKPDLLEPATKPPSDGVVKIDEEVFPNGLTDDLGEGFEHCW